MEGERHFFTSSLALAGAVSGVAGLLAFLVVHQLTIVPIWFIAPLGLVAAVLGGLAVAWAYQLLGPRLPGNLWRATLIFTLLLTLTQVAAYLVSAMQAPIADMVFRNQALPGRLGTILARFAVDLFLVSALSGAAIGWWIGRSKQAAGRMALAGLAFAAGPGHNVPFFAGTAGSDKMWLLIVAIILSSWLSFAGVQWIARRFAGRTKANSQKRGPRRGKLKDKERNYV